MEKEILKCIDDSIDVKTQLKNNIQVIKQIINEIINAYKNEKKVIWFGNGGSAADAQHLSCELVSKFYIKRKPLESISLTTNTSLLTSIGNDYIFSKIFERQVESCVKSGDVVIGITTSGTSPNIISALDKAKERGAITIALTGNIDNTKINSIVDYLISVPSKDVPRIQESHIMIGHIICYLVEKNLFGGENN